jgi:putative heme-binding domain-containing protein
MACALAVATLLTWTLASRAQTPKPSSNAATQLEQHSGDGRKLFQAICSACHGLDGRGGERGPDIAARQEVLALSDAKTLAVLQNGIPSAGMPSFAKLGDVQLKAVLAYLRTLQGKTEGALPGNPEKGKILYLGKAHCADCHMVDGHGGFLGADLSVLGLNQSAAEIRNAILGPGDSSDSRRRPVVVTTRTGQSYKGIARNEDNFSLQMQTFDGVFHPFLKSDLTQIRFLSEPIMPADYAATLSSAELDDLASYLLSVARKGTKSGGTEQNGDDDE